MSIANILSTLRSDNGRIFKESLLESNKDNDTLKRVFLYAYNPNTNYYIKKIPFYIQVGNTDIGYDEALNQLDLIANRNYTGGAAIRHLTDILSNLPPDKAKVIAQVVERDLKCGVTSTIANKIWKDLIPETPYMRCSQLKAMKKANWPDGLFSQTKADGSYVNVAHHTDGTIELYTRSGKRYDVNLYPQEVLEEIKLLPVGFVFTGEQLVYNDDNMLERKVGNGILNSVGNGTPFPQGHYPVIEFWDMIPVHKYVPNGVYNTPYRERFDGLSHYLTIPGNIPKHIKLIESVMVYSMEEAMAHYRSQLAIGLEGTILKYPDSIWKDGTSKEQFKLKVQLQVELEIVGFNEGKGRNADTFGSMICKSSDGELVCNVSGRGDEMRALFNDNKEAMIGKIITVESNSIMFKTVNNTHSLFLPIFVELREDKKVADTFDRIVEQFESLVK